MISSESRFYHVYVSEERRMYRQWIDILYSNICVDFLGSLFFLLLLEKHKSSHETNTCRTVTFVWHFSAKKQKSSFVVLQLPTGIHGYFSLSLPLFFFLYRMSGGYNCLVMKTWKQRLFVNIHNRNISRKKKHNTQTVICNLNHLLLDITINSKPCLIWSN